MLSHWPPLLIIVIVTNELPKIYNFPAKLWQAIYLHTSGLRKNWTLPIIVYIFQSGPKKYLFATYSKYLLDNVGLAWDWCLYSRLPHFVNVKNRLGGYIERISAIVLWLYSNMWRFKGLPGPNFKFWLSAKFSIFKKLPSMRIGMDMISNRSYIQSWIIVEYWTLDTFRFERLILFWPDQ